MTQPNSEWSALFAELADGTISDADLRRLEAVLSGDRRARDAFRRWMEMESALPWVLGGDDPVVREGPASTAAIPLPGPHMRRLAGMWLGPVLLAAAGVAALAWRGTMLPQPPKVAIADVSADAAWHDDVPRGQGDAVPEGVVRLDRGAAQLRFESGPLVAINAPAEFEVLGAKRLFLRSGRITSLVPPEAQGFTVVAPNWEIVDLGTEFTVGVERDGKTDVYVVDGEVDVAGGHSVLEQRVRLTQGFATRLGRDSSASPRITQQPIVLDSFDRREADAPDSLRLRWRNVDPDEPAEVVDGAFRIPIDGRPGRLYPIARVALEHDLSAFAGRRAHVSFKASLPDVGTAPAARWAGIVVDDRRQPAEMAYKAETHFGVLVSPSWQAQVFAKGQLITQQRVFARDADAIGPYQVVVVIDDSPTACRRHGGTTLTVMINGVEIVRDRVVDFCSTPRIQFQTNTPEQGGGYGFVVIDDVCVSIEVDAGADSLAS